MHDLLWLNNIHRINYFHFSNFWGSDSSFSTILIELFEYLCLIKSKVLFSYLLVLDFQLDKGT